MDSIEAAEQKNTTFVFVTPRNWPGKEEWARAKRAEGIWKDVRALDASDLEQWIEQSVPAQSWIAERLGIGSDDILSLEECWARWAKVTNPELHKDLFYGSIETHKGSLEIWLKQPPSRPYIVTANSEEEALAFIACALQVPGSTPGEYEARAVVLRSVSALRRATKASSAFIPIIVSPEVEEASAGIHRTQHTLIVRRRNSVDNEPDIALDLLDDATFKKALTAMGIPEDDIPVLARASGQSPTILRRHLSEVPAIKSPPWAQDGELTRKLVPLGFAGVWHSQTSADQEILSYLSDDPYEVVERSVTELLRSEQCPVWSVGRYRGVSSKLDVLYGVHRLVTSQDLEKFFFIARIVLSERDPSLDLPEEERYAASLYGKTRDHSAGLRNSICETLVVLAVHGNNLFKDRLGIDVTAQVGVVIRDLLTPITVDTWASQRNDLPRFAEAAPDQFLDILECDLDSSDPMILALLKPASTELFGGGCLRSGLLWALEILAWKPERLLRVASLLARLSEPKIEDNWVNKPDNSLKSIFRSWMPRRPQTSSKERRRLRGSYAGIPTSVGRSASTSSIRTRPSGITPPVRSGVKTRQALANLLRAAKAMNSPAKHWTLPSIGRAITSKLSEIWWSAFRPSRMMRKPSGHMSAHGSPRSRGTNRRLCCASAFGDPHSQDEAVICARVLGTMRERFLICSRLAILLFVINGSSPSNGLKSHTMRLRARASIIRSVKKE